MLVGSILVFTDVSGYLFLVTPFAVKEIELSHLWRRNFKGQYKLSAYRSTPSYGNCFWVHFKFCQERSRNLIE